MSSFQYSLLFDETKIACYNHCKCCNNLDFISKNILLNKCWEPNISSLFLQLLKNDDKNVVFDIGCNIGYYSLISSKYCSKIYAFDANSKNIELLNNSININNFTNITTICCAVTDDERKLFKTGVLHEHNVGSLQVNQIDNAHESNIKSIKLDNFINQNKIKRIDILKIDIEGSELSCLYGLDETLSKNIIKNIIVEITPIWNINTAKDILLYLKSKNYNLFDIGLNETGQYIENNFNILNNKIINIEDFVNTVKIQTNILAKK